MAFGRPTRYLQLDVDRVPTNGNKREAWDRGVTEASEEYKMRMVRGQKKKNLNLSYFLTQTIINSYFIILNILSIIYAVIIAILTWPMP